MLKRLKLKNDVIFKAVYGRENEECKEALIVLLNLILDRRDEPIVSVTYMNPFNIREIYSEKEAVLDIKARTQTGEIFDVEMQILYDPEYIERTVYYHGGMITQALAAGESYGKLKKTISIHLLDYIQFQNKAKYHSCFRLMEEDEGDILTSLVEMHYIELPKVNPGKRKKPEELTQAERLLEFLRCEGENGSEGYCESLKREGGKEIEMTDNILQRVTEEEILREKAIARDKYLHQQASIARGLKELEKMNALKVDFEVLQQEADKLQEEVDVAKQEADKLQEEVDVAKQEADKLQEEVDAAKQEADKLQEEVDAAKQETDKLQEEFDTVKNKLDTEEQKNFEMKKQLGILINALMQTGKTKEEIMQITKLSETEIEEYFK